MTDLEKEARKWTYQFRLYSDDYITEDERKALESSYLAGASLREKKLWKVREQVANLPHRHYKFVKNMPTTEYCLRCRFDAILDVKE